MTFILFHFSYQNLTHLLGDLLHEGFQFGLDNDETGFRVFCLVARNRLQQFETRHLFQDSPGRIFVDFQSGPQKGGTQMLGYGRESMENDNELAKNDSREILTLCERKNASERAWTGM